jgi:chromatin remodeling complex protein RSC6
MNNIILHSETIDNNDNNNSNKLEDLFIQFDDIIESLIDFKSEINVVQQKIRALEKNVKRQVKSLKKEVTKSKKKGNKQPSGFAKPSKVTKELCEFMNKEEGSEIARTEVTRAIVSYVKENKLENIENGQIILPDLKLKTLLDIDETHQLTYFNIQKYMNKHFIGLCK